MTGLVHYCAAQNFVSFSRSFTRCSIAERVVTVVFLRPNPSQQNDAVTAP